MAASPRGTLGVADTSLLVVGSIVGAGIFLVSPSVAAGGAVAGRVSRRLAARGRGGARRRARRNGELGGLFPRSGGEYVYLREAYGPAFGFLSGWTSFWIVFPGSIAALASGFGSTARADASPHAVRARPSAIGLCAIAALTVAERARPPGREVGAERPLGHQAGGVRGAARLGAPRRGDGAGRPRRRSSCRAIGPRAWRRPSSR